MKLEMQKNEFDGKLITFCGLDGCGKTTQIKRLTEWLESKGHKVYLTKQPSDFVRNSEIFRTYMDTPTHDAFDYRALSLLCASDRVQHSNRVISQKLKEGYVVISDRYYYSCLANLIARGFKDDIWILSQIVDLFLDDDERLQFSHYTEQNLSRAKLIHVLGLKIEYTRDVKIIQRVANYIDKIVEDEMNYIPQLISVLRVKQESGNLK